MTKCLCKVCGETDAQLFYDSIKTYCKEHWKERVRNNRSINCEYYREFDRKRANLPHRVEARAAYRKTIAYKEGRPETLKRWDENHPHKKRASTAVGNAIRAGKIARLPCFVCGHEKAEGHHPDYSSPLDVVWLCDTHHKEVHVLARNIERDNKKANY